MTEQIVEPSEAEVEAAVKEFSSNMPNGMRLYAIQMRKALQAAAKVRAQQEQGR